MRFSGRQMRCPRGSLLGPTLPKTQELGKTAPVTRPIGSADFCLPPEAPRKLSLGLFTWRGKVSESSSTRTLAKIP